MLQYITDNKSTVAVVDQVKSVLAGGCRWIQISTDSISDDEIKKIAEQILPLCLESQAFLLIESKVELAKEINLGGVFLKKDDMPCSQARMILGPGAVIGVAASSMADILKVSALDIDYYGILPYAAPEGSDQKALGLEGVKEIISDMEKQEINIPHVAIGGIRLEDVSALVAAGVNGIAVSKAISNANDMKAETEKFIRLLPEPESAE